MTDLPALIARVEEAPPMTHDEKIVEAVARAIYATPVFQPAYGPWQEGSNRAAQQHARVGARAAITAYQAEAWQPIETAPKERGAKILGWCVFPAGAEVRLCPNSPAYLEPPGATRWYASGMSQKVTHWQSLPNPPASP